MAGSKLELFRMSASKDNEADEAMKALTWLFLTQNFPKAHFRCCVDGPKELDLFSKQSSMRRSVMTQTANTSVGSDASIASA
jgi:hypothetical protein